MKWNLQSFRSPLLCCADVKSMYTSTLWVKKRHRRSYGQEFGVLFFDLRHHPTIISRGSLRFGQIASCAVHVDFYADCCWYIVYDCKSTGSCVVVIASDDVIATAKTSDAITVTCVIWGEYNGWRLVHSGGLRWRACCQLLPVTWRRRQHTLPGNNCNFHCNFTARRYISAVYSGL